MSNNEKSGLAISQDILGELSPQQQKAIAILLEGKSTNDAARGADVTQRTVFRWLAEDDNFQFVLKQSQAALLSAMTGRLIGAQNDVIDKLTTLMQSVDERIQLKAAIGLSEFLMRWYELNLITQRVSELEKRLND